MHPLVSSVLTSTCACSSVGLHSNPGILLFGLIYCT
ncbi:MAG: hypothetical protein QOE55_3671 [Acidobacteriaceae bacterium]|jgi:hypothetical protein|nr:hypothetical protein [Acidobacteriaceae bacterium]